MKVNITLSTGRIFNSKKEALKHFKDMLHRYSDGDRIQSPDNQDLSGLLNRYDSFIDRGCSKIGAGISHFSRKRNVFNGFSSPSFWVHRVDGSSTDFSYITAINGKEQTVEHDFTRACRAAVNDDLIAAKRLFFSKNKDVHCELTGVPIHFKNAHLDHAWPTFAQIVDGFKAARGWSKEIPEDVLTKPTDAQTQDSFSSALVAEDFRKYHHTVAVLRFVKDKVNLSMASGQRKPVIKNPVMLHL